MEGNKIYGAIISYILTDACLGEEVVRNTGQSIIAEEQRNRKQLVILSFSYDAFFLDILSFDAVLLNDWQFFH